MKKPTYLTKTKNVFEKPAIEKLRIMYGRKKVESLWVTKVLFMNEGKEPIMATDIHPEHPISIIFKNGINIFDYKITYSNRSSNNINIELIKNSVIVHLDYLNENDGFIIQVLHSNLNMTITHPELKGEIIGVDKIAHADRLISFKPKFDIPTIAIFVLVIFLAFIANYFYRNLTSDIAVVTVLIICGVSSFFIGFKSTVIVNFINYNILNIAPKEKELLKEFDANN
ncbi:MAG: hypothetical protein AAFZ15_14690 [Bacteroidota bacterium]